MSVFKKIITVLVAIILASLSTYISASETEDFTMKSFDKGYITFIFDDTRMPFTKDVAQLFKEFGMPMSCATVANRIQKNSELHKILLNVQENGGEILSHGYAHTPITSEERSKNPVTNPGPSIYKSEDIEKELGQSWKRLTNLGFNVNGMIQVGCGGDEGTADYALVETVARKYYKYSNASGVSSQYQKSRTFMNRTTMSGLKKMIDLAAENKEWIILSAHDYNEISSDLASDNTTALREILEYIMSKHGTIEVVTWNYIYNEFGEYTGPAVPTAQALEFLEVTDNDDVNTLNQNAYVEEPDKTASSESTVTSSQDAAASDVNSLNDEKATQKNTGKIIAICAAAVIALASVIAAVIIILKFK